VSAGGPTDPCCRGDILEGDLGGSVSSTSTKARPLNLILLTGYLLSAAVATPILGRLGDLFGKRRILLLALGGLAVGSLVSALATSLPPARSDWSPRSSASAAAWASSSAG